MSAINELQAVMKSLRDPQSGCPWDRAQNMLSIAPYTIEEAYEVVEAIENGSIDDIIDELGDLLFHIIFYAEMASEKGEFDFNSVCLHAKDKLVRRHPHVFAGEGGKSAEAVAEDWEKMKALEKEQKAPGKESNDGLLGDVSIALPAMKRAEKLQRRAASVGFDWTDAQPVYEKLLEEIGEMDSAMANGENPGRLEEELGDVMFSCVNLARHLGIDAEQALRNSNRKFQSRFSHIETGLALKGKTVANASQLEMEELWEEAKNSAGES